jgi:hypothetical protein
MPPLFHPPQPDPDHPCEICGGAAEYISLQIIIGQVSRTTFIPTSQPLIRSMRRCVDPSCEGHNGLTEPKSGGDLATARRKAVVFLRTYVITLWVATGVGFFFVSDRSWFVAIFGVFAVLAAAGVVAGAVRFTFSLGARLFGASR